MRKITAGLFISLDGVVEAPEKWTRAYATRRSIRRLAPKWGKPTPCCSVA